MTTPDPNAAKIRIVSVTAQAYELLKKCRTDGGKYDLSLAPADTAPEVLLSAERIAGNNKSDYHINKSEKDLNGTFRRLAKSSSFDVFRVLEEIALDPTVYEQVRIQASEVILQRAYGSSNKMNYVDMRGMLEGRDTAGKLEVIQTCIADGEISVEMGKLMVDIIGRSSEILTAELLIKRMEDLEAQLGKKPQKTITETVNPAVAKPAKPAAITQAAPVVVEQPAQSASQAIPVAAAPTPTPEAPKPSPYATTADGMPVATLPPFTGAARAPNRVPQQPSWAIQKVENPTVAQPPFTNGHAAS